MNDFTNSPLLQLPNVYRAFYGGFPQLTTIQKEIIQPILTGCDVVVQAATGTGKTEAVLAPCLEQILQTKRRFSIIYIIPTRALATDLERRLQPIFARLELTLGIRTGDHKRGGQFPDVMLTTPESFDVMLGSRQMAIQQFLARLNIIIIDEVHTFLRRYRGQQLVYCMQRLARRRCLQIQKIALSATIEKPELISQFFTFSNASIYLKQAVTREIVPHIVYLKQDETELVAFIDDLYERWEYRKLLIFTNSRRHCDQLFGILNVAGRFQGCCGLHYSNLEAKSRQQVEQRFRQQRQALCISTSTLELGIDIGNVDSVILFEPPDSASAFLQRIGRSNRRQQRTLFWGICRGKLANMQLLRFMALLRLARQGQIEIPQANDFPSVVIQQTASCLYEKQQLSLAAMQNLLPQQQVVLTQLWPQLQLSGWLKEIAINDLFAGGWRYYDALQKQQIWHNFPPNEDDYLLQLEQQTIANLPRAIVDQLQIGDQVQLVGRRLQILDIIKNDADKRVIAKITPHLDGKELFWLGVGFRISYDVAQAIQQLLSEKQFDPNEFGLFVRTRNLLEQLKQSYQRYVTLANGMQVGRLANGNYSYWTFLGALGNLLMKWLVEEEYADAEVTLHDLGFECSIWIDFQSLEYPIDFNDFQDWVRQHLRQLSPLFSLNAFCRYLPHNLLINEVTHYLFDPRFIPHFSNYQHQSNAIINGDKEWLVWNETDTVESLPIVLTHVADNLLILEKQRRNIQSRPTELVIKQVKYQAKRLSASCIGSYFYHKQCQCWLSYQWLPVTMCPPQTPVIDHELQQFRQAADQQFKKQVLTKLSQSHYLLDCSLVPDVTFIQQLAKLQIALSRQPQASIFLANLKLTACAHDSLALAGVGIPDLIRVTKVDDTVWFAVGDINARAPLRYHQKWQVVYYVWLLQQHLHQANDGNHYCISPQSFIITRSSPSDNSSIAWHQFDNSPFLQALPTLFEQINSLLQSNSAVSHCQVQSHCVQCEFFAHCYQQSLQIHDIQYLPRITKGLLQKFQQLGLNTLAELDQYCQTTDSHQQQDFSPQQYERIQANLNALQQNHVQVKKATTRAYPANLTQTFLLDIRHHPLTGLPYHLAFQVINQQRQIIAEAYWLNLAATDWVESFAAFQQQLAQHWRGAINSGKIPHMVDFDGLSWQLLEQWSDLPALKAICQDYHQHHTALVKLLTQHFYLPIAGKFTLYKLNLLFDVVPIFPVPASLWHHDALPEILSEDVIKAMLQLQAHVWCWLQQQLISTWQCTLAANNCYLDFIAAEKYYHEEQTLSLQSYPLAERVARFRAIGPIRFCTSELDAQGHFCYQFEIINPHCLSKFRAGDFLKLAPLGTPDIQTGFPVILIEQQVDRLWLQGRKQRLHCDKQQRYSLEEDLTDWNSQKLSHAVQVVFADDEHPLIALLDGLWPVQQRTDLQWLNNWLQDYPQHGLNQIQQQALKLPFQYRLGLIEGPPGTGKTYLLAWTIITLIFQSQHQDQPLRIVVTALTHQAIDQVLAKVAQILNQHNLPQFLGSCYKWGHWSAMDVTGAYQVQPLDDLHILQQTKYVILGATCFGLYQVFNSKRGHFEEFFDWVIFDEASQILIPQALLTMLYGKGQFLLYGDDKQLPPIVVGEYPHQQAMQNSILKHLLGLDYGVCHVRLNQSYRMNQTLCQFPSDMWYDGELKPDAGNKYRQLELKQFATGEWLDNILYPEQAATLVLLSHAGCETQSSSEVAIASQLAYRLLINYQLAPEQIALISPHRTHNNLLAEQLQLCLVGHDCTLPLIDTIERVQGAERDVIIFSLVASNPDYFTEFLNNPRRFNVAITRARKKLIVIGSLAFFSMLADNEDALVNNQCFKQFMSYCKQQQSLFNLTDVS